MSTGQRSTDVFEAVADNPLPALAPLADVDDYACLERHGLVDLTPRSRRVIAVALRAMGYPAFHAQLPPGAETLLRSTNMREGRLFAPVYSATMVLEDDPRALSPLARAASLVVAARSFCDDVMSGRLPPDEHRGQPLEMGQYPNLFATSIEVKSGRARLYKSRRLDQIAVVVRRRVFVQRIGGAGEASAAQIESALAAIVARADQQPAVRDDEAPGVLSAADSKTLRGALRAMESREVDARSLASLRDCSFVLCLDLDDAPATYAAAGIRSQVGNPANRWYLASLQLVVFGNARASLVCSFPAYLDGNVMMRVAAQVQRRGCKASLDAPSVRSAALDDAALLRWTLDARRVRQAWSDVARVRDDQPASFEIRTLGRDAFTKLGVDAVNAFVLALALATKRRAGDLPNILQLVTVSRLRCVPVGAAVVTTPPVHRFVDLVASGGSSERAGELLHLALASMAEQSRIERQKLSLRWTIEGFVRTRRGPARARALAVMAATLGVLRAMGAVPARRIVISHPEIVSEVPIVGRPGIKLPYVDPYGLHYQMFADHTVLTFMPGTRWKVRNADFLADIETALHEVVAIAARAPRTG